MFYVVLSSALLVAGTGAAIKAVSDEAQFIRARRRGVQLQAEVVGNDSLTANTRNGDFCTPVVRYHLDGRAYTAALCNPDGVPGTPGSGFPIIVHPKHPYAPFDRYGGMGARSRNLLALFALTAVDFVLMLATR